MLIHSFAGPFHFDCLVIFDLSIVNLVLNRFDVKGYPTLKIFRNGELSSDYNGPREAAGISKFMRSQVGMRVSYCDA